MDFEFLDVIPQKETDCKGLFFRGYKNLYYDGGVHLKQGLKPLKRMSCKGCSKCGWYDEQIFEMIGSEGVIIPEIEDGALYSVTVTNISTDWETGYCDGYDFEFFKVGDK